MKVEFNAVEKLRRIRRKEKEETSVPISLSRVQNSASIDMIGFSTIHSFNFRLLCLFYRSNILFCFYDETCPSCSPGVFSLGKEKQSSDREEQQNDDREKTTFLSEI